MTSRTDVAPGRRSAAPGPLGVALLFARIVAWPIAWWLIRFLFFWVLVIAWLGGVGIALSIGNSLADSDSPAVFQGLGQLAAVVVLVGGGVGIYAYIRRLFS